MWSRWKSYLFRLAFIREYGIKVLASGPGAVTVELPYDERFSGPPGQFPASMVGTIGDVAAVSSCLSLLPRGWGIATIDFTVKMTGVAKGERLQARGASPSERPQHFGRSRGRIRREWKRGISLRNNPCQHQKLRDQG